MMAACRKSPNTATPQSSKRSQVRHEVRIGHSTMSARCPVCPKADTAGRFMSTRPSGRGLINAQPQSYRCKLDECEVVCRELVVASCHTPAVFDLVEEPLDQISGSVKIWAEAQCLRPVSFHRDIRPGAVLADKGPDPVGI